MHAISRFAIAAGLVAGTVSVRAQDPLWVPPGLSFDGNVPAFDFQTNPALQGLTTHPSPIWAISAHKTPSDPPGRWTVCLTVRALRGYGNPGFSGFILAKWEPSAAVPLVLTHEADAVNDAFVDYNLNLEPVTLDAHGNRVGGRYAVFDRFRLLLPSRDLEYIGVFLATRPDDVSPFGEEVQVANVTGPQDFADPALGYVDGRLKLFYGGLAQNSAGQRVRGILMDDLLDVASSPTCAGHPVLVAQPVEGGGQTASYCHSPSPITGADGDVEGLFLAEGDPTVDISSMYFAADLDADTPHVLTMNSTNDSWLNSGGTAGASLILADPATPTTARVGQGAWLVGDETTQCGTADVTMAAYGAPGQQPAFTIVFASHRWLPTPVSLPLTLGQLAIPPMAVIGLGQVPDADQVIHFEARIPRQFWFRGTTIPIQGMSVHRAADGTFVRTLTNSATIRVR